MERGEGFKCIHKNIMRPSFQNISKTIWLDKLMIIKKASPDGLISYLFKTLLLWAKVGANEID